jgi:hypothetical protein
MNNEKLELKHLAPFLPYGINILSKLESNIDKYPFEPCEIVSIDMLSKSITVRHMVGYDKDFEYITYKNFRDVKPILRPLSDLVKEIEVNGERFIPLGKLHYKYCLTASGKRTTKASYEYYIDKNCYATFYSVNGGSFGIYIDTIDINKTPYRILRWLFEWHFDVFGLIEKGLADVKKPT